MTARHKKHGGFKKLVQSLETTPFEKRQTILEAMRKEDPDFVSEVEASIFKFEEFIGMNDLLVCEIVGALGKEMRTVAVALFHAEPDLIKKFTKNMKPPEQFEFRDQTEGLSKVLERERHGARFRIIEKARELEKAGKFVLKKYSSHYAHED